MVGPSDRAVHADPQPGHREPAGSHRFRRSPGQPAPLLGCLSRPGPWLLWARRRCTSGYLPTRVRELCGGGTFSAVGSVVLPRDLVRCCAQRTGTRRRRSDFLDALFLSWLRPATAVFGLRSWVTGSATRSGWSPSSLPARCTDCGDGCHTSGRRSRKCVPMGPPTAVSLRSI